MNRQGELVLWLFALVFSCFQVKTTPEVVCLWCCKERCNHGEYSLMQLLLCGSHMVTYSSVLVLMALVILKITQSITNVNVIIIYKIKYVLATPAELDIQAARQRIGKMLYIGDRAFFIWLYNH